MYSYIARQPILNRQKRLVAYELLFRDGPSNRYPDIDAEQATSRLLAENLLHKDIQEVAGKHRCFINFSRKSLLQLVPTLLNKRRIVVEILEDIIPDQELLDAIRILSNKGYHIALDDYQQDPRWHAFLPYISIIKFDIRAMSWAQIRLLIGDYQKYSLKYVAEKVETEQEYRHAYELGIHYFQGYFFSKPEMLQHRSLATNQLIILDLLREAARREPDLERLERLFAKDVALSYKLLRYVNNLAVTKAREISSYRQAIIHLGSDQLCRFIALLAAAQTNGKPPELHRMCLVRARFCEQLARSRGKVDPGNGFICGLFSMLDGLLDQPLEQLLDKISLDDEVVTALLQRQGELAFYLGYIRDLESAQWEQIRQRNTLLQQPEASLLDFYLEAILWANKVFSLDHASEG